MRESDEKCGISAIANSRQAETKVELIWKQGRKIFNKIFKIANMPKL